MKRRIILGIAIAAAAAIAAFLFSRLRDNPWQRLIAAVEREGYRGARGRLAAFDSRGSETPTRSGRDASSREQSPEILAPALQVLTDDQSEYRKAVAAFLSGFHEDAEARFARLVGPNTSAAIWNDYAVVLAAKAERGDNEALFSALAAADRALDVDPTHQPAYFNRALIIDQFGLTALARTAWNSYLALDGTSAWAMEARQRLREIETAVAELGEWQDQIPLLLAAATSRNTAAIENIYRRFPAEARRWAETDLLVEWGQLYSRGDESTAALRLALAREIAEAEHRRSGDAFLRDAVASIEKSAGDRDRLRVLSAGYVRYGEAITLNRARQTAAALPKFTLAREHFENTSSPAALPARYYSASGAVDAGEHGKALAALSALERDSPAAYRALRALIQRLRGTVMAFDGLFEEAATAFKAAQDAYLALGDSASAADMAAPLAAAWNELGRPRQAFPMLRDALRVAGTTSNSALIQRVLHAAAFVALREERWDVGHSLLNLEAGVDGGSPARRAEAMAWRILAAERAQLSRTAATELDDARKAIAEIADPNFRNLVANELRLVDALLSMNNSPETADRLLTETLETAEAHSRTLRQPQVLVARAVLRRRLGRAAGAETDLRRAIALIEQRGGSVQHDLFRDTFLSRYDSAHLELSDLLASRGDVEGALLAADSGRARLLSDRRGAGRVSTADAQAALEPGTAILTFGVHGNEIVSFVLRRNALRRLATPVPADGIEFMTARFLAAVAENDEARIRREGLQLGKILIEPARVSIGGVDRLVVVADDPLDRLPFAGLVQDNGRFLIEDFVITAAPSIRAYVKSSDSKSPGAPRNVVTVGNPSFDRERYPSLASLQAAAEEAKEIAAMYPGATLLLGTDATRRQVLASMANADIAHIATHAIADRENPDKSRLLLAPDSPAVDGDLSATDIAEMDLGKLQTVVLAGCRTAVTSRSYGYVKSLAAAFLAAGVDDVVGSLWDLDDAAARSFSLALHRELRAGRNPWQAVRTAQLQLLRSGDDRLNDVKSWAAMQHYGVGR